MDFNVNIYVKNDQRGFNKNLISERLKEENQG